MYLKGLEGFLRAIDRPVEAVIDTTTEPDMVRVSKAGEPNPYFGRVRKGSRVRCSIGSSYQDAVNEQRLAEGKEADFLPAARKWGTPVPGTPLIQHKGELYLQYLVLEVEWVVYELDRNLVTASIIEPWLRRRRRNDAQGVEDEVLIRCVKLGNVQNIQLVEETETCDRS